MSSNVPKQNTYERLERFKLLCQRTLPIDFDDSLTDYELLGKLVNKLNSVIDNAEKMGVDVTNMFETYSLLLEWVNSYFDRLDVQDEINYKIDELVTNGTLLKILAELIGYVTPEMFGCVGDGITDDTIPLKAMFNSNSNLFMFTKGKTYLVSEQIEITKDNVIIVGNHALLKANTNLTLIDVPSYEGFVTIIGENVTLKSLDIDASKTYLVRSDIKDDDYADNTNKYYAERSKGLHGLVIKGSKNVIVEDCKITNSILGICSWFSERITIKDCYVSYTLADGIATYSGNKNVTIDNCICSDNGDDAFSVYASTLPTLSSPTKNVIVKNCKSINCYARALLNHGGKNIIFDNIIIEKARQFLCVLGQGYADYSVFDTNNTIVTNIICSCKNYGGFGAIALGQLEYAGKVILDNVYVYPSDVKDYDRECYLKYGSGDIDIRNSKFEFFSLYGERETDLKLTNCEFINGFTHSKLNSTNVTVRDCKFTSNGSYLFTVSNSKYVDMQGIYGDNKLIEGNLADNSTIITDNADMFSSGFFASNNVTLRGLQVINALPSVSGIYKLNTPIIVQGVLYKWNGTEWVV